MSIDFAAARKRHSLSSVARRTGYVLPETSGDVFVSCPMPGHDDSTPSMLLHLDDDRYHCFGCGAGGDVVQWVSDIYGLDARGALAMLDADNEQFRAPPKGTVVATQGAARARHLNEQPDLARTSAERVRAALMAAWRYYTLPRLAARAAEYLADRGIDIIGLGGVAGHTPYKPDGLVAQLRGRGFTADELVDAGLARRREGELLVDAFQQRVLVPVRDDSGVVIGLIGRLVTGDERRPKYLNPARTVVYDKSTALYMPTRVPLAPDGQVVIVEGTLDALAIAAAARTAGAEDRFQAVSTSGLGFSDVQIAAILAMHPRAPVQALDGDAEGQRTAAQLAARIAQRGRESAIVTLPAGEDPASWLAQHGPQGLAAITRRRCLEVDGAQPRPHHAGEAAATVLMAHAGDSLDDKVAAAIAPTLRMTPEAARRYAQQAAAAIAPVVVAASAEISCDNRGRVNHVIETVATYGKRFPAPGQQRFIELAVLEIEKRGLAPGAWAQRQVNGRLDLDVTANALCVTRAIVAPARSTTT
jgi:DNA primase